MTDRKLHFVGQLQRTTGRPENVELVVDERWPEVLVTSFTDGDTTPSVRSNQQGKTFKTANTSGTTISDFNDGFIGQSINVVIGDANTTIDFTGTNLTRSAGTDWTPSSGDYLRCTYDGSTWYCITWDVGVPGTDASTVTLSATALTFSYDNSTGTPSLIGPSSIVFTANRQNISGSTTWALEDSLGGDETAKLTSTSDTSATLTEANFAAITNNTFVKATATADSISDTVTIVKLLSGADGAMSYLANVYLRKATAPTEPVTDDGSYNFDTATLTPPSISGGSADNWSTTIPAADGNPLYVSQGLFEVGSAGGTDTTVDWTAPVVLNSDGAVGADGNSVFVASVYLRKSTSPTEPVTDDGQYNFTTNTLTPPSISGGSADNWSTTPPATDGNPLYISTGVFSIQGVTGTDTTVDWTAPAQVVSDGAAGGDGNSVHVSTVYLRSSSAPSTPTGGQYNFTTNVLTVPAGGWSETQSTGNDPLYASSATWSIQGTTGTDSSTTWSTPVQIDSGNPDPGATIGSAIANSTISDTDTGPATVYADFKVDNNGVAYKSQAVATPSWSTEYTWIGDGANTDYECRLQTNGNSAPTSGTTGSWLACSSDRTWNWTKTADFIATYTIQYRRTSDNLLLAEASVNINLVVL